jgi:hypothetical protein
MEMQITVNNNGTSVDELVGQRLAVMSALSDAITALRDMTPNGRDYPGRPDACKADREIHYARIAALSALSNAIMGEALAIQRQRESA